MKVNTKPVDAIQIADLEAHPVWEFPKAGETVVCPVRDLPVKSLTFRFVGTQVRLANGSHVWADIGNVDTADPRQTEQFLTLTVFKDAKRFTLARYFDFDYGNRGPEALASFLGLPLSEVFPISYDITQHVIGDLAALSGTITKDPREKLTNAEIMALAVGSKIR
jgi:hypothetical protein